MRTTLPNTFSWQKNMYSYTNVIEPRSALVRVMAWHQTWKNTDMEQERILPCGGWGHIGFTTTEIIHGMGSANERRRYIVTSSLIGWAHTQEGYGLSQWATTLHCNVGFHWLSPYRDWSLSQCPCCWCPSNSRSSRGIDLVSPQHSDFMTIRVSNHKIIIVDAKYRTTCVVS